MMSESNCNEEKETKEKKDNEGLFSLFCFWTFILLCRPQDLLPFLAPLRPALLITVITFLGVLLSGLFSRGASVFAEQQVKLYSVLFFIMVLGIPFSLYKKLSFELVFPGYILVVLYFFVCYKLVNSEKRILTILYIATLGTGLYSFASVQVGSVVNGRLVFGSMFDANDLAFFSVSFLPLTLLFLTPPSPLWKRLVSLFCVACNVLLIVLTGSRGGMLAFGAVIILLLFRRSETVTLPMKGIFIGVCLVILGTASINLERYATIFMIGEDYNVRGEEGRLAIWSTGLRIMMENPIIGVGVGCFNEAIGRDRETRGAESTVWQTAHNSAVQIGTETGVIGFILFLLLSLNVIRIFNKGRKFAASKTLVKICEMGLAGFLGLFISAMFLSQAYSIYWAFYVALSAVISQLLAQQQALHLEEVSDLRGGGTSP